MRAAFRRAGGIVVAAVLATGVLAAPAQAEPSSVTGTLVSAATGESLEGCVDVFDLEYSWVSSGCTDGTGHWTVESLETGVGYKVQAYAFDSLYKLQWSGGADTFEGASVVEAPTSLDFALAYAREVGDATISGTITADDTGAPLQACATVYTEDLTYAGSSCSGEDGAWSVGQLVEGAGYKVEVESWDDQHLGEWATDAASYVDAEVVTAPATVDFGLAVGGHLVGTLTRADGEPAAYASVDVTTTDADGGSRTEAFASTDELGQWSALVHPGDYTVHFSDYPADQWAFGQASSETASHFAVAVGDTVRVDDRFLAAASVRGTVRSDATGVGVPGACVTILTAADDPDQASWVGDACADDSGAYSVAVSEPGTYIAEFTDPQGRYVSEYSGDTRRIGAAASFDVARGEPATVDASLATGSVVTGRAVDAKTGVPIAGACASAYEGHTGGSVRGQVPECSGADGRWTVRGLPAGQFALNVGAYSQPALYADTWAFKATSQATADLVAVGSAQTTSVRDVKLEPGGTVSGVVTGPDGQPVADAWVNVGGGYAGRAGPGEGRWSAKTDEHGRYTVTGVPPGTYTAVVYQEDYWGDLAPEWYRDAGTAASATAFKVKALKSTGVDFRLNPAGRITGSVVDADGAPVDRYLVGQVFAADGSYIGDFDVFGGNTFTTTSLPAGSFTLSLSDPDTGQTWWYDSATDRSRATAVTLGEGQSREVTIHLS